MLKWQKDHAVPRSKADALTDEERETAIITGIFKESVRPEFTEEYDKLIDRLQAKGE
jgi:hypothetical protein